MQRGRELSEINTLPEISTARTQLRVLLPEDAELLLAFRQRNRHHLTPWEPTRVADYYTVESARAALTLSLAHVRQGTALHLAAFDDRQRLVGLCNFTNVVRGVFQACHLGYSLDGERQGQGLMTEILEAALAYVFHELHLHRVMANYMPANVRSAAVLQRLGFQREGLARAYLKINGAWEDHILTAKLHPDYN